MKEQNSFVVWVDLAIYHSNIKNKVKYTPQQQEHEKKQEYRQKQQQQEHNEHEDTNKKKKLLGTQPVAASFGCLQEPGIHDDGHYMETESEKRKQHTRRGTVAFVDEYGEMHRISTDETTSAAQPSSNNIRDKKYKKK